MMNTHTADRKPHLLRAVVWGGLISGTLDLAYALPFYRLLGVRWGGIPQTIASGLLGMKSYEGGAPTVILGVFLEYVITFGATLVYYAASGWMPFLTKWAVRCGILYGVAIYYFMHWVVIPLSRAPRFEHSFVTFTTDMLAHMFLIGLPMALVTRRYRRQG